MSLSGVSMEVGLHRSHGYGGVQRMATGLTGEPEAPTTFNGAAV
jgi:hypothetical protein